MNRTWHEQSRVYRREYKGFYIEDCPVGLERYAIWHVATGALAGAECTVQECKQRIDEIHESADEYARFAGTTADKLERIKGRYRYK